MWSSSRTILSTATNYGRNFASMWRDQFKFFIAEWLKNFTVIISDRQWPVTADQLNGPSFIKCGQYAGIPPSGATVTVKCTPLAIVGRYVYIHQLASHPMMNVCEVEVFGG